MLKGYRLKSRMDSPFGNGQLRSGLDSPFPNGESNPERTCPIEIRVMLGNGGPGRLLSDGLLRSPMHSSNPQRIVTSPIETPDPERANHSPTDVRSTPLCRRMHTGCQSVV